MPRICVADAETTVMLTVQDVQLDQPETVHLWEHGFGRRRKAIALAIARPGLASGRME